MQFGFSAEQEELRTTVRTLLQRAAGSSGGSAPPEEQDTPQAQDHDPRLWSLLAEQVGAHSLAIPEEYGGAGFSLLETHVVVEELGAALAPLPFLGSAVLVPQALLTAGDDGACSRLLPGLAGGDQVGALAWAEDSGSWNPADVTATAESRPDGGWWLSGTKHHVLDGYRAGILLVAARTTAGVCLFEVDPGAAGVGREPLTTMDQTRPQARITLDGAPGRLVGTEGDGTRVLEHVLDLACVALSAEQVGGAARCLDMTVDYAKQREQFGRPIGSFQALKHRMADLLMYVESARSASQAAAFAAATGSTDLPVLAATAKSYCSEAYFAVAAETIQIHGGIGCTWEHDAHRYFKRAQGSTQLFGDPAWHRARLARDVGITPSALAGTG